MLHELKTWPEYFGAICEGRKTFEVRKADRPFAVGDVLDLQEFDPEKCVYTGRGQFAEVLYLMRGGSFGIADDTVVMAIRLMPNAVLR